MHRVKLTDYDFSYPREMLQYLRHYGPHFNKKLLEFANSNMFKIEDGKKKKINFMDKEALEKLLQKSNIKLENNQLYDHVYVANMCKADFLGSSVPNEQYLAKYVKDVIDDVDAPDGLVFNRWYADISYMGIAIDWEEML